MTEHPVPPAQAADEAEIFVLIERWSRAVRKEDRAAIRRDHDDDIMMFDVPPPFQSRGIEAYMDTWELFFSNAAKPVMFEVSDIEVTAGVEVAFATATGRCVTTDAEGEREPVIFRLTMGLRKCDGHWRITHEHHSVPAE
ncbi:MAG TPA: SgcJ/EcaC family oxidoreductase [Stellaceae bacterium]|jgi:uncharacterized protein (TIGR02246 family)|nr:SgcJ/EcaC family oxidoreductase [Stellaceae bacterium]